MNQIESKFNPGFLKDNEWKKTLAKVDGVTDRLGKGVDEKIKETVAVFLINDFSTSGSCEGHLPKEKEEHCDCPNPYPWVEVYALEPEGWGEAKGKKKEQLDQEWLSKNLEQQKRMMDFLQEFYQGRESPFDARLVFEGVGRFGGFRVQSFGAGITAILSYKEKEEKLVLYRKEMQDFTNFLKDKYFLKE